MKRHDYKSYDDLPLMLSVKEVGTILGISRTGAYELVKEKGFPCIKVRGRIIVPKQPFIEWLEQATAKGTMG